MKGKRKRKRIPNSTPYLKTDWIEPSPHSWYKRYFLHKEVKEKQLAEWFAVIFKRAKINNLQQARDLLPSDLKYITKTDDESYVKIYGAYFDCMCVKRWDGNSLEWFDQSVFKGADTLQKRFDYIISLIDKYYPLI